MVAAIAEHIHIVVLIVLHLLICVVEKCRNAAFLAHRMQEFGVNLLHKLVLAATPFVGIVTHIRNPKARTLLI
ncbi:hypothetical protein Amal_04005 [Acetobacter malorum]|uniref:Uncharacterized protein n=1 Tax=Acetobacter malorum TaxID=178901 RepID=A0A177FZM5_9PROT|nr:hypothetical protein Amal_04005 [Acetobacter malorum]